MELATGYTASWAIDTTFNFVIYPLAIYQLGVLQGGIVMTFASFLLCWGFVVFYDWSKRDWFGIEAVKGLKAGGESRWARLLAWMLNKSDPAALLVLSIKFDPFVTTMYLRQGAYNGMNARDWRIFIISLVIGNAYWIAATFMGLTLVDWALKQLGWGGLY